MSNVKSPTPDMEKVKKRVIAEYRKGSKPKELAEKYEVSVNTVKSWIKRYKDKHPEKGASDATAPRKAGAPLGNTNAVGNSGGGAPYGNTNALKHGGYSKVFWDSLSEEEQELRVSKEMDEEDMLLDEIDLLTIRERRIMKRIERFSNEFKSGQTISGTVRSERMRAFANDDEKAEYTNRIQEKIAAGERLPGREYNMTTTTEATYDIVQRLEEALSRCQDQKRRAIEALSRLRIERGETGGSSVVDDWVTAVMEADEDGQEG